TCLMRFLRGFGLKPPQNFMFYVLSPGDVLDVTRRGGGEEVAGARLMSPITGKLYVDESLSVARRA
ncbi:hypothetical protein A2U01_0069918, partial [Trifolium medium]|nr:hypothetical protein [Trifolium medium]